MYAKDLSEPKYEFLIKKHEDAGIRHFNEAFCKCSNTMDDVYDIDDYNSNSQKKIFIVFDNMIATLWRIKNFKP